MNPAPHASDPLPPGAPPDARLRHVGWRWFIWALPLAALIIVGFVMVREWLAAGPGIEVLFPVVNGIGKDSQVRYRGVQVGTVDAVRVSTDLKGVVVRLSMDSTMTQAIRAGTKFWIAQPSLSGGGITQVLGGPYIGMEPGGGAITARFIGCLEPPPLKPRRPGTPYVLYTDRADGISPDTPVYYRGLEAGQVTGVSYEAKPDRVEIDVLVYTPFDRSVHADSHFWRAGGISLGGGSGQGIAIPPLGQLLGGGIAFETPAENSGPPAAADAVFPLYDSQAIARRQLRGPLVNFQARLPGAIDGLSPGSPVTLRGIEVGQVQHVAYRYDARRHDIETPVTIAIDPALLGLGDADPRVAANHLTDAVGDLVTHGLRATVGSSSLILGIKEVQLDMDQGLPVAQLDRTANPPEIPATSPADIQGVMASVSRIADRIQAIPFETIGSDVKDLAAHAKALVESPQLTASLDEAHKALVNIRTITGDARPQVKPILASLRRAADDIQSVAANLNRATGGSLREQQDLGDLIQELTQAARSVRVLADYLDRHPEALLEGRPSP